MIVYVNPDDTTVATTMAKIKTQMYGLKRDFKLSLHTLATSLWWLEIDLRIRDENETNVILNKYLGSDLTYWIGLSDLDKNDRFAWSDRISNCLCIHWLHHCGG
jgi:hypothetical protein